jgi:acylglycerol lipase
MDNAVADLDELVVLAGEAHSGVPVFLLGHSMGGAISLSYAIRHQQRLTGLILSSPVAAIDDAPAPARLVARTLSVVSPKVGLLALDPSLVSRDQAVVEAYESDPLVHHGKLPARTVVELATAAHSFPDTVGQITIPTLIMYGTADRLVPPRGSVMLGERIGSRDKTVKAYEGLCHEIMNEPEQAQVLDDMCAWIAAHVGDSTATAAEAAGSAEPEPK